MFCLYLNQPTAASDAWTFCVWTWCEHTNTQTYSVTHLAIQLSYLLVLLGLFLYLHHLCETVTFTPYILDTVRMTWHFSLSVQKQCLHITLNFFFNVSDVFFVVFSSASLQGSVCIWMCIQIKDMPFTFHQRYGQLLSQKSFQYLKITLLLHGLFPTCSHSTC